MFVPPQGFRHAAVLLLTSRARALAPGASREALAEALERLARDLAGLADDMRAAPESVDWMISEYRRVVDRMPQDFDRARAMAIATPIIGRVAQRTAPVEPRDLFLVYVPEDRLPVAALLAVELVKRRISVAVADYEVATGGQLAAALHDGLRRHRAGVVLRTAAFAGRGWDLELPDTNRVRIVHGLDRSAIDGLAEWARRLRGGADTGATISVH